MINELRFLPETLEDLKKGFAWYESRLFGLGSEFLSECKRALDRIQTFPELAASGHRNVRSVRLHRFPYVLHYRIEEKVILVIAILYGGRDPSILQERIED